MSCVWPVCQKNKKINKISTGINGPLLQWNLPGNDGANRLPENLTSAGPEIHLRGSIFVYGCTSDRGCLTEGGIKLSSRSCHIMEVSLGGLGVPNWYVLGFMSRTCGCSVGSKERVITVTWQRCPQLQVKFAAYKLGNCISLLQLRIQFPRFSHKVSCFSIYGRNNSPRGNFRQRTPIWGMKMCIPAAIPKQNQHLLEAQWSFVDYCDLKFTTQQSQWWEKDWMLFLESIKSIKMKRMWRNLSTKGIPTFDCSALAHTCSFCVHFCPVTKCCLDNSGVLWPTPGNRPPMT